MDELIKKAHEASNYRTTLHSERENLRLWTETSLTIGHSGGIFRIDRELITFVKAMVDLGQDTIVIFDNNKTPVRIEDAGSFLKDIVNRYVCVSNEALARNEKLRKARSVEKLIDRS